MSEEIKARRAVEIKATKTIYKDIDGREVKVAALVLAGDNETVIGRFAKMEDAVLDAAAPDLLEALRGLVLFFEIPGENANERFERVAAVFAKETGYLRPGKDCRLHDPEIRHAAWDAWVDEKTKSAVAAIAKATRSAP